MHPSTKALHHSGFPDPEEVFTHPEGVMSFAEVFFGYALAQSMASPHIVIDASADGVEEGSVLQRCNLLLLRVHCLC